MLCPSKWNCTLSSSFNCFILAWVLCSVCRFVFIIFILTGILLNLMCCIPLCLTQPLCGIWVHLLYPAVLLYVLYPIVSFYPNVCVCSMYVLYPFVCVYLCICTVIIARSVPLFMYELHCRCYPLVLVLSSAVCVISYSMCSPSIWGMFSFIQLYPSICTIS